MFEDPAIKYDNMGEVAPTTIENYLVSPAVLRRDIQFKISYFSKSTRVYLSI